jgi:hypothetical protein
MFLDAHTELTKPSWDLGPGTWDLRPVTCDL